MEEDASLAYIDGLYSMFDSGLYDGKITVQSDQTPDYSVCFVNPVPKGQEIPLLAENINNSEEALNLSLIHLGESLSMKAFRFCYPLSLIIGFGYDFNNTKEGLKPLHLNDYEQLLILRETTSRNFAFYSLTVVTNYGKNWSVPMHNKAPARVHFEHFVLSVQNSSGLVPATEEEEEFKETISPVLSGILEKLQFKCKDSVVELLKNKKYSNCHFIEMKNKGKYARSVLVWILSRYAVNRTKQGVALKSSNFTDTSQEDNEIRAQRCQKRLLRCIIAGSFLYDLPHSYGGATTTTAVDGEGGGLSKYDYSARPAIAYMSRLKVLFTSLYNDVLKKSSVTGVTNPSSLRTSRVLTTADKFTDNGQEYNAVSSISNISSLLSYNSLSEKQRNFTNGDFDLDYYFDPNIIKSNSRPSRNSGGEKSIASSATTTTTISAPFPKKKQNIFRGYSSDEGLSDADD